MNPITRAHNAQAVLEARNVSFDDSVVICKSHYAKVVEMPSSTSTGRCAIAYFQDDSRLEFSDARPKGFVID
jgi:hypothetical protein